MSTGRQVINMFTGSMVALVTPFKNGKIDEAALRKLIEFQIAGGTDVIVPCGTTGESATLDFDEHLRVIEITVDEVNGRVPVLAGAGANSTAEAIYLHQQCQKLGVAGTLQVTPYYNKPPQEGLYQHFKAIASSCDLPVVLYNVPGRTSVNMLPETTARLSEIKSIVGIKEASGNLEQVQKVIQLCPKDFVVLSGEDAQTLDILKMGGQGAISVTANVVPQLSAQEWDVYRGARVAPSMGQAHGASPSAPFGLALGFDEEKLSEAEKIHELLLPLHDAMFYETNPIPVKAALSMMGLIEEEYRLPLVKMSEGNRSRLQEVMKKLGVI